MNVPPTVAIVPLAGRASRLRPASLAIPKGLFPLVDRDGLAKPVIHFILEEAFGSGIDRVCLVTGPGADEPFRWYLEAVSQEPPWRGWTDRVQFAIQPEPEGFGHAVLCAREIVDDQPVLVLLGDHLYLSGEARRCTRQVLDCFARYGSSVSAVQRTPESKLHLFGTVAAEALPSDARTYRVSKIVEKPDIDTARRELRIDGMPAGEYLSWFGIHALTPGIFDILAEDVLLNRRERGEFQLTGAQARLAEREPYFVHQITGRRLDMGDPPGFIATQQALAEALESPSAGLPGS
jgi:UTP--glucose-1-phosphate uridylyltransferase